MLLSPLNRETERTSESLKQTDSGAKIHCLQPSITPGSGAYIVDETDQPKDLRDSRSTTTINLSKQQSAAPISTSLFPCGGWINQRDSPDRDAEGGLVGATEHFSDYKNLPPNCLTQIQTLTSSLPINSLSVSLFWIQLP